jgi:hypothetical protein
MYESANVNLVVAICSSFTVSLCRPDAWGVSSVAYPTVQYVVAGKNENMAANRNWLFSLPLRIGMQHVPLYLDYVININHIYLNKILKYMGTTEEPHFLVHDDERRI